MSQSAGDAAAVRHVAGRLGLREGQVVQELGYDDDCDEELRQSVEALTGSTLVDEDFDDVVDALVDSLVSLGDGGVVWLLTPKPGRPGHVEPGDIGDAAPTAGLHQTSSISAAADWSGTRLAARRSGR